MTQRLARLNDAAEAEAPARPQRFGGWWIALSLLVLAGAAAGAYAYFGRTDSETPKNLEFQKAERGKIVFTIIEKGELEAARNTDVTCRVRASGRGNAVASTIKWVIDNGSKVKRGDLLMQLDDAGIKEQIKNQEIVIAGARDTKIQADSNLEIVRSENESALKTAQNNVELAKLDLEKYVKGELEKLRKDVMGRITLKESELLQSRDRVGWSSRMVKKGYISESQARGDELKLRSSEIDLDKLQEESRVLNQYDAARNKIDFQNKLAQAIVAEKVARTQAIAKEAQAMAKVQSATAVLNQEETKLEDLREDLRNCRIVAPNNGMVVYYIPESSRFGGQSQQQGTIALGENVREGQKLMRIPDLSKMLVRVKIHESLIPRLRGDTLQDTGFSEASDAFPLVGLPGLDALGRVLMHPRFLEQYAELDEEVAEFGLPAAIKVASLPTPLAGHLMSVDPVASATDWMSSDVKVYPCLISVDESVENLKPGMSAEVTIQVDERTNALKLPVQAVLEVSGKKFCYVLEDDGQLTKRDLHTGLNNNKFVEVLPDSKLKEGENVLLNARSYAEKQGDLQSLAAEGGEGVKGGQRKGRGMRPRGSSPGGAGEAAPAGPSAPAGGPKASRPQGTRPQGSGPLGSGPQGSRPQGARPQGSRPQGSRPGGGQASGLFEKLTPAQQGEVRDFFSKSANASSQERKQMLEKLTIPAEMKKQFRDGMKQRGMEIAD